MGQQGDGVTRGEVFSRFLVVFFVETAEEFLEDGAHANVGEGGYLQAIGALDIFIGEIDAGVGDALDDGQQAVVIGQFLGLGEIIEVFQNVPDILAVTIEVFCEVIVQEVVVVGGLGFQPVQRPLAVVEITEAGDVLYCVLVKNFQLHFLLGFHFLVHFFFRGLQEGIQTAEYNHREYNVTVLATEEHVAEHVVRNVPDEAHHLTVGTFHI